MYANDILTATEQLLISVPELIKGLKNFGFTVGDMEVRYVVNNGDRDGSITVHTHAEKFNIDNEHVMFEARKMVYIRHILVQFVCYTDYTNDMLTIQVAESPNADEFRIACGFSRFTAVFLSDRDITRKLKNEDPVEVPVDRVVYSGSINFISQALYPVNKGTAEVVETSYFYPTYTKVADEQKYLMDKYSQILEVLEHSDTGDLSKFDVYHMKRCIENIPEDRIGVNYRKELLDACEMDIDTLNFKNPELIQEFFNEYRKQLRERCIAFEKLMGFSIEDEVQAKHNSWFQNKLLELADAINR